MEIARRSSWRSLAGLWLALGLALPPAAGAESPAELRVAAAVSLREPVETLAREFEATRAGRPVAIALGASSWLAVQIRAGAPVDVFLSADADLLQGLVDEGLLLAEGAGPLARNQLVLLAASGLEPFPRTPQDLTSPGIRRVAVAQAAVPVGRYARAWLERVELLEPLRDRLVATEHARATLAAVEGGHVDAAVVYATDARLARRSRVAFTVPVTEAPPIVYAAARARGSGQPARELLAYLRGEPGRAALAAAGFAPP